MSRFHVSRPAAKDLEEIVEYIARGSLDAAEAWIEQTYDKFSFLAQNPGLGRPRDELQPGIRSHALGRYLILYRQAGRAIEIVRVVHGSRKIKKLFPSE